MRRTILLADDSPTIRRLVTQTFSDGNFEIVAVNNGDAAIKTFEEIGPSVVLADIYMPGKNGYEVCAHIRKHPRLSATPVVLLVGAFDAFDEHTAREAGATANITKPFEPAALIELVRSIQHHEKPESEQQQTRPAAAPQQREPDRKPEPASTRADGATRASAPSQPAPSDTVAQGEPEELDILGLSAIFTEALEHASSQAGVVTEEDIDRIVDRVIQRISKEVIESIAWDVVPDISERIIREELKRIDEG